MRNENGIFICGEYNVESKKLGGLFMVMPAAVDAANGFDSFKTIEIAGKQYLLGDRTEEQTAAGDRIVNYMLHIKPAAAGRKPK